MNYTKIFSLLAALPLMVGFTLHLAFSSDEEALGKQAEQTGKGANGGQDGVRP